MYVDWEFRHPVTTASHSIIMPFSDFHASWKLHLNNKEEHKETTRPLEKGHPFLPSSSDPTVHVEPSGVILIPQYTQLSLVCCSVRSVSVQKFTLNLADRRATRDCGRCQSTGFWWKRRKNDRWLLDRIRTPVIALRCRYDCGWLLVKQSGRSGEGMNVSRWNFKFRIWLGEIFAFQHD